MTTKVFITYAHKDGPASNRFRQYIDDPLPPWAVDVREEAATPTPRTEDGCKAEELSTEQMEIRRLRHELEGLTNAGVVECMVRNQAVYERISELERDLAAAQEANAKLRAELASVRGHAEAMATTLDQWSRLDGGCKCRALDDYRADFPKEGA